jgi:GNAT superfamily N-acetyltransferase
MQPTDLGLVRELDAIEAEAYRDLFAAAPAPLARGMGLQVRGVGGATLLLATTPTTLFNRAIGLGNERPATPEDVDAIAAEYRRAGVHRHWIHVGSAARPGALPGWLDARGYVSAARASWAKVVRDASPPPTIATSLTVREVDPRHADRLARVLVLAHELPAPMAAWNAALVGRPRWRAYAAFDGDEIVAGGFAFVEGRHGWLGMAGTLPTHRRRGAQSALLAMRIRDALADGCKTLSAETGEPVAGEANPSLDNLYRCGFERACARANLELRQSER